GRMWRILSGRTEPRPEMERGVADDESRVVVLVAELLDVGQLRVRGDERRLGIPDVFEEELDERDTRHRALADEHSPSVKLRRGALGKQHDASNRTVAGNGEVREQQIPP